MIEVAVIGAGFQGANLARALNAIDGARVSAIVGGGDQASRLASELETHVATLADLAAAPPDFIVIAVPNDLHAELATACLEIGSPLFVEKPVAIGRDAISRLEKIAQDRTLLVGHSLRTTSGIRRLLDLVEEGAIGELREVRGERVRLVLPGAAATWKTDPLRSGGEIYHEIHELDLMCLLGGRATEVFTLAEPRGMPDGIDRAVRRHSGLMFANGLIGIHDLSRVDHAAKWAFAVSGTEGAIIADFRRGLVERLEGGRAVESWPVFDIPSANDSLVSSSSGVVRYNRSGGATSEWMQRLSLNVAGEIVRVAKGGRSILERAPFDAVDAATRILEADAR